MKNFIDGLGKGAGVAIGLVIAFVLMCCCCCGVGGSNSDTNEISEIINDSANKEISNYVAGEILNNNKTTISTSVWANQITPLTEFEYDIDYINKTINITDYNGRSKKVWIAGTYTFENEEYTTILESAVFLCNNITSVIIGEGVQGIDNCCFNSASNLKNIYLPSSITPDNSSDAFNGYSLFDYIDDFLQNVYFGGTEEQWQNLVQGVKASSRDSFHVYIDCDMIANDAGEIEISGIKIQ